MTMLLMTSLMALTTVAPVEGKLTVNTVCIAKFASTSCPRLPFTITKATSGTTLSIWVDIGQVKPITLLNGFDIIVTTNNAFLKPISAELALGTISQKAGWTILKECVGGALIQGNGCSPSAFASNSVEMQAAGGFTSSTKNSVGGLFQIDYTILAFPAPNSITIGYATGCSPSDALPPADPTTCVQILDGTSTGLLVAVNTANFS